MKLQYLGTGAAEGIPALFCNCEYCVQARKNRGKDIRTRSQAIVDDRLLIDFPADSFGHMNRFQIDLPSIQSVLITHTHQDHLYLEDFGLRFDAFCHKIKGKLTLYGNDALVDQYRAMYRRDPEDTHLDGRLDVRRLPPFQNVRIEDFDVCALPADHDPAENCCIYLIQQGDKAMLYGNDSGWFPQETWSFLRGTKLDLISLDCTHLRYPAGQNHMGIPDVLRAKEEFQRLGCTHPNTRYVVTHFSHNGHMLHDEIVRTLEPYGIAAAYDGCTIEF